jgi:DNA-binding transcriptional LysR family regulator
MAPGFYDAVLSACRAAGFEPELDEHAAGSTVWGYIAAGRGVALVVGSLREQLPRGLKLLSFAPPQPPPLSINAVWNEGNGLPALEHFLETAEQLAADHKWT